MSLQYQRALTEKLWDPSGSDYDKLHHKSMCQHNCTNISPSEQTRLKAEFAAKEKFQHDWLKDPDVTYCKSTGLWWLVYAENEGTFCALCRKHDTANRRNKMKIFNTIPSTCFRATSLREHVKGCQHGRAVNKEHLQCTSCFEAKIQKEKLHGDEGIVKAFSAYYFTVQQEIANSKINPRLELLERIGGT